MRSLVPKLLIASVALLALVWVPAASAAPTVSGKFELGTELETNNKIVAGPDGNMWFTLAGTKNVGSISPAGLVREFEIGIANPIGIAPGPEGRIWVVATNEATSFLPADPEGTEQNFNSALINGQPNIALGPEGLFWVASLNKVAKFSPANFNGTITEVKLSGTEEISPKDIDIAGSLIVIADSDTGAALETSRVVTFTSAGVETDFTIPGPSQGVAGAPTGQIGYSAPGAVPEQAGLITPPGPASAFELIGDPFGVALGADGAFWVAQFAKGGVTRIAPTGQTSFLGGLPIESPRQIAAGPGNTLWVTLIKKEGTVEVSAIARVSGLEPPATTTTMTSSGTSSSGGTTTKPVPNTTLGKGFKKLVTTEARKATVQITFSSSVAGSSFQCSLVRVPAPKKGKKKKTPKPAFANCASPRVLHLAPGKYRFAVRATAAGVTDATPAESTFTVVRRQQRPKHR
jgi:virginiamycin B lyase